MTHHKNERQSVSYIEALRRRNRQSEQSFQAIDEARRILLDLEQITVQVAEGKLPDIGETAHLTHSLRGAADRILVGIVESATLPVGGVGVNGIREREEPKVDLNLKGELVPCGLSKR